MKNVIIAIVTILVVIGIFGVMNMPEETTIDTQENYEMVMKAIDEGGMTNIKINTYDYGTTIMAMDDGVMHTFYIGNDGLFVSSEVEIVSLSY